MNDATNIVWLGIGNLKKFRLSLGETQDTMADKLGIKQRTYAHYEKDRKPKHQVLMGLKGLGFPWNYEKDCPLDPTTIQLTPQTPPPPQHDLATELAVTKALLIEKDKHMAEKAKEIEELKENQKALDGKLDRLVERFANALEECARAKGEVAELIRQAKLRPVAHVHSNR